MNKTQFSKASFTLGLTKKLAAENAISMAHAVVIAMHAGGKAFHTDIPHLSPSLRAAEEICTGYL